MTRVDSVTICGYELVRKAESNFDALGRGVFPSSVPRIGDTLYHGVDRMPWFDLDELHYGGTSSSELSTIRRNLRESNRDASGIYLLGSLAEVRTIRSLLEQANPKCSGLNEIIAIYSRTLEDLKGHVKGHEALDRIGFDVVGIGEWSLIRDGVFDGTFLRDQWKNKLNEWGLLDSEEQCVDLSEAYRQASSQGRVEHLGSTTRVEPVLVYRTPPV